MHSRTAAGAARAVAAASLVFAGLAVAQPKPALVQERDEPGRNPWQASVLATCVASEPCLFRFGVVPPGKRLVLTTISVFAGLDDSSPDSGHAKVGPAGVALTLAFPLATDGGSRLLTAPMNLYVEAGDHAFVILEPPAGREFRGRNSVTLVGYLVTL